MHITYCCGKGCTSQTVVGREAGNNTPLRLAQVMDQQEPGKREDKRQYKFPMTESANADDPGWESEVSAREEEVGAYEGQILAREFKTRLAYNIGQVHAPFPLLAPLAPCVTLLAEFMPGKRRLLQG